MRRLRAATSKYEVRERGLQAAKCRAQPRGMNYEQRHARKKEQNHDFKPRKKRSSNVATCLTMLLPHNGRG